MQRACRKLLAAGAAHGAGHGRIVAGTRRAARGAGCGRTTPALRQASSPGRLGVAVRRRRPELQVRAAHLLQRRPSPRYGGPRAGPVVSQRGGTCSSPPLGPSRPTTSPARTSMSTPCSTGRPPRSTRTSCAVSKRVERAASCVIRDSRGVARASGRGRRTAYYRGDDTDGYLLRPQHGACEYCLSP